MTESTVTPTVTPTDESPRVDPSAQPPVEMAKSGERKIPHPKKKQPTGYRVLPREKRHGLLIVNTGDGKGKTTAALGLLLRASGRDMSVGMFQFIKGSGVLNHGEQVAARKLGIDITPLGNGCTLATSDTTNDRALAQQGWAHCKPIIAKGDFDILILDELTLALDFGWLDVDDVIATLATRPIGTHVVVTGRRAPQALIDAADLVTDMRVIKHPLRDQGILAQAGIDV